MSDPVLMQLKGVFLTEVKLQLNPPKVGAITAESLKGEYDLNFEFGTGFPDEKTMEASIRVTAKHKEHPEIIDLIFKASGFFEGESREALTKAQKTAFTVVMPHLRSYVMTITALAPQSVISLPLMNVGRVIDKAIADQAAKATEPTKQ